VLQLVFPLLELLWRGLLASCEDDKTIKLWDLESGKPPRSSGAHQARISRVAFSQDGGLLGSASDEGTVRLWNTATWWHPLTCQEAGLLAPAGRKNNTAARRWT
jgi:WD40 repeat protein